MPPAKADWSSKWLTKTKLQWWKLPPRRQPKPLPQWKRLLPPRLDVPRAIARRAVDRADRAAAVVAVVAVAATIVVAAVVVGDGKGRAGFGHGKAREVPEAISKATAAAKKAMIRVPLRDGRTLHHDGRGHFGAGNVTLRSAPAGTGIIAGGPMRAVFESLGVADVVTKSVGTSNPYNMNRATFEALGEQTSPKSVAQRRGKKVSDLIKRGGASDRAAEAEAAAVTE